MNAYTRFHLIETTVMDMLRILRPRNRQEAMAVVRYVDGKGLEGFEQAREGEGEP